MVEVADFLGVNRQNIYRICRHYGIDFKSYLKSKATKSVKSRRPSAEILAQTKPTLSDTNPKVSTDISQSSDISFRISDYTGRYLGDRSH